MCSIQVSSKIYGFKHACDPAEWHRYSGFAKGRIARKTMAEPSRPRSFPSLTNYQDKYILVIGGYYASNCLTSVDMYNVKTNRWQAAPEITEAREEHSSCCLENFTFIFGGNNDSQHLNSFERIDMDALTAGDQSAQWELLTVANQQDPAPGSDVAMAPIGDN